MKLFAIYANRTAPMPRDFVHASSREALLRTMDATQDPDLIVDWPECSRNHCHEPAILGGNCNAHYAAVR